MLQVFWLHQQDFDNREFFGNVEIGDPPAIGMLPPNVDSVTFDPLPDVREIQRHQQPMMINTPSNINESQLRPKIAQIGHDRVDSDDEGDVVTNEALLLQERVKLEKLLCKMDSAAYLHAFYLAFVSFRCLSNF